MTTRARWFTRPEDLSEPARRYWLLHGPGLVEAELLTPNTAEKFKSLCRRLALMRAASDEIAQHGVTVATASGARKSNPAVAALLSAHAAAAPLLRQFGMNSP